MSAYYNQTLKNNSLKTYQDYEDSLIELLEPVYQVMAEQKTPGRFHLSNTGSVYDRDRRDIEGFLRTLWGLGPLFSHKEKIADYQNYYDAACEGILAGTDADNPFYWGELHDYDQLFVEMGALATFLILTKDSFWKHLSTTQQQKIYTWTNQINTHTIPNTNWLFFRLLVNTFYDHANLPVPEEQFKADLAAIESYYLADGWYFDGYENQIDYYIPFGMQYYAILLSKLSKNQNIPELESYKKRGAIFAKTFKDWFAKDGSSLPFGRSLTYRFAQSAYFSASIFAGITWENFSLENGKYLLLNNMRQWFQQPIFSLEGFLTIGYGYPNLVMAEGYNAPGSPYWAMKNYILLALDEDHSFWNAKEIQPEFPRKIANPYSRMLLVHNETGEEVQAFTAGQHSHEHAHGESKYEKFVYSTTFGVSVAKGGILPKQGAFDNTLAVSEKNTHFETVFGYEDYAIHEDYVTALWRPYPNTTIRTFLVPCYPWHIRIHLIENDRPLNFIAGSFSAPADGQLLKDSANEVFYQASVGTIGIRSFSEQMTCHLSFPEPNTNLLYNKTALTQGEFSLDTGKHKLIYACVGDAKDQEGIDPDLHAELINHDLHIFHKGQEEIIHLMEL